MSRAKRAAILAALVLTVAPPAAAQQTPTPAQACPAGQAAFGHIGILDLACDAGCEYAFVGPDGPFASFRSEPRIRELDPYIARANGLREGDIIVAVDDHLITTREGARRLVSMTGGQPVELRIRRGGREQTLQITPLRAWACMPTRAGLAPATAGGNADRPARGTLVPTPARAPSATQPAQAARTAVLGSLLRQPELALAATGVPSESLPTGALGFAIECADCGAVAGEPLLSGLRWVFRSPPRVYRVEAGGPADRAGLRTGDLIVGVNGMPLTTAEGARTFGAIRPGDRVHLEYLRGGRTGRAQLVAQEPVTAAAARHFLERRTAEGGAGARGAGEPLRPLLPLTATALPGLAASLRPLRFTGALGNATIEVHSPHRVTVNEADAGREIEIVIGDSVVRVRLNERPDR